MDYSGVITVINNARASVELDGVIINLIDTMGSGDATDAASANCLISGSIQAVSGTQPLVVPADGRVSCNFTLRSASSGSLVGTATVVDGGDGVVSKGVPVTTLLQDSSCDTLVYGLAASELGPQGVLAIEGGAAEQEVCQEGSKVFKIRIPADSKTERGCLFPVSTAWPMKSQYNVAFLPTHLHMCKVVM